MAKSTSTIWSTEANPEDDTEQHNQNKSLSRSPPLELQSHYRTHMAPELSLQPEAGSVSDDVEQHGQDRSLSRSPPLELQSHYRTHMAPELSLQPEAGSVSDDVEQHGQDRSLSRSPPRELQFKYHMDMDSELLLQPLPRSLSGISLVSEVAKIYIRLAEVESKCIETDKLYLAAAKEKDPLQKVPLTSDKLQSLVALHKEVYTLFTRHIAGLYVNSVY